MSNLIADPPLSTNISQNYKKCVKLLYSCLICKDVTKLLNIINLRPTLFDLETTNQFFFKFKEQDFFFSIVVYCTLITCRVCSPNLQYRGKTKRCLESRMYQYPFYSKNNNRSHCTLCVHTVHKVIFLISKILQLYAGRTIK